jgi:hypothetical protein
MRLLWCGREGKRFNISIIPDYIPKPLITESSVLCLSRQLFYWVTPRISQTALLYLPLLTLQVVLFLRYLLTF